MTGYPHGVTVEVQRPVTTADRYHNQIPNTWETVTVIIGAAFAPNGATTLTDMGRDGVDMRPTLYVRQAVDVRDKDRCIIAGTTYTVEGDPDDWTFVWGGQQRTVIKLRKVE